MTPTQTKQLSTTRGVSCNISTFHWYIPGIYLVYTGSLSRGVPPIVNQAWHLPDTVEILFTIYGFTILGGMSCQSYLKFPLVYTRYMLVICHQQPGLHASHKATNVQIKTCYSLSHTAINVRNNIKKCNVPALNKYIADIFQIYTLFVMYSIVYCIQHTFCIH